jgi:hypothetical protein
MPPNEFLPVHSLLFVQSMAAQSSIENNESENNAKWIRYHSKEPCVEKQRAYRQSNWSSPNQHHEGLAELAESIQTDRLQQPSDEQSDNKMQSSS